MKNLPNSVLYLGVALILGSIPVAAYYIPGIVTSGADKQRIERAYVGTSVCSSHPCTIASKSSDWLDQIRRFGTGRYVLHIKSGVFSEAPTCVANTNVYAAANCYATGPTNVEAPSATRWGFDCVNDSGTNSDAAFTVICMGPR